MYDSFYLSSWSYGQHTHTTLDADAMWTTDDWIRTNDAGSEFAWQNLILACCGNDTMYADLSSQLLERTGHAPPVIWHWGGWLPAAGNHANAALSLAAHIAEYTAMRTASHGRYLHLPAAPWGIMLADEPPLRDPATPDMTLWLADAVALVKTALPHAVTYLNLKYGTLACANANDTQYYSHCRPDDSSGSRYELAASLGRMGIGILSTDQYYSVPIADYRRMYSQVLYPHMQPHQRVVLLPFAAHCEIGCAVNARITSSSVDCSLLATAKAHMDWAHDDDRVTGMFIYRLKNIWSTNAALDACDNPTATGLGLVDRCADGSYAMPKTLSYYTSLLSKRPCPDGRGACPDEPLDSIPLVLVLVAVCIAVGCAAKKARAGSRGNRSSSSSSSRRSSSSSGLFTKDEAVERWSLMF